MRHPLAITIALFSCVRPATLAAQTMGAYLADRIDQAPLPMTDRVTDPQGTTYLVEFDRLVLSLRNGNRFRAVVRFRRTLTSVGGSGANDFAQAVRTAVVNKRAGGMGLISGRKAFQRERSEGIDLLHTIQDVYLDDAVTIA